MGGAPASLTRGEPLSKHTSLKVGGPADYFAAVSEPSEIAALLAWATSARIPTRIIGGGSNLLVSEDGVDGLVVKAAGMATSVEGRPDGLVVVADAGTNYANMARKLARDGYGGLEWAANVPGTVGGAVVNNAGAFGGDTATSLVSATIVDAQGTLTTLRSDELGYAYRTSKLKRHELGPVAVVRAELRIERSTAEVATALVARYQTQRTASQPRQLSAGSVFANPAGSYSGLLIQEAGLKGTRVGGAEVSEQHANFIVNAGGATARDVYGLVRLIQDAVWTRSAVWLVPEIELFGRWTGQELAELRHL